MPRLMHMHYVASGAERKRITAGNRAECGLVHAAFLYVAPPDSLPHAFFADSIFRLISCRLCSSCVYPLFFRKIIGTRGVRGVRGDRM
jgi:hypothetical protein